MNTPSQNPQVAVPFTLNNFIICLLIVNGRLPLSLFIHSVDNAGWLLWTQAVARWRPRRPLRLEHGVRHLAFGQVWAELCKYPVVHLLTRYIRATTGRTVHHAEHTVDGRLERNDRSNSQYSFRRALVVNLSLLCCLFPD